jgi:hypothetical protein
MVSGAAGSQRPPRVPRLPGRQQGYCAHAPRLTSPPTSLHRTPCGPRRRPRTTSSWPRCRRSASACQRPRRRAGRPRPTPRSPRCDEGVCACVCVCWGVCLRAHAAPLRTLASHPCTSEHLCGAIKHWASPSLCRLPPARPRSRTARAAAWGGGVQGAGEPGAAAAVHRRHRPGRVGAGARAPLRGRRATEARHASEAKAHSRQ